MNSVDKLTIWNRLCHISVKLDIVHWNLFSFFRQIRIISSLFVGFILFVSFWAFIVRQYQFDYLLFFHPV